MVKILEDLVLAYDDNLLLDPELLLLEKCLYMSPNKQSNFSLRLYDKFDRKNLGKLACKVELHFNKQNIPRLEETLQLPETHAHVWSISARTMHDNSIYNKS